MKNTDKKFGAVIYVRVSSDEQVKGTSLDDQEARCRAYCAREKLQVLKVFREEGASAKTANRKVLLDSIEFCRKHKQEVSKYVVLKVDRLARNTNDHFTITKMLLDYRIRLSSVSEPIDDSPIGKLMETVLAGTSEFDNAIRTQRCTNGMLARLKSGIWPWKPTAGYLCAQNKKHGVGKTEPDKPDPKVFPIIQSVLKAYAREAISQSGIVKELEAKHFEELTGIRPCLRYVEEMLTKRLPFYAGLLPNPWPEEDGTDSLLKGKHEPMISTEEMRAIQAIRKGGRGVLVSRVRSNPTFPLRRLVVCDECRHPLTGSTSKGHGGRYAYYHCYNKDCNSRYKGVRGDSIEPEFMSLLKEVAPDSRFLTLFGEACLKYWSQQQGATSSERNVYAKTLQELETRRSSVFEMRESREYTASQFKERIEEIDKRVTETKLALNRLPKDDFNMKDAVVAAKDFMSILVSTWDKLTPETRERFQKIAFPNGIPYSRQTGFGTPEMGLIFSMNKEFLTRNSSLVDRTGFEPATPSLQMRCSTN